jgi:hypothetical protein
METHQSCLTKANEPAIGLPDRERINASNPEDDDQFADDVTHPTFPALLEIALAAPGVAPKNLPRTGRVTTFLTGAPRLNQLKNVAPSEVLGVNTSIAPVPFVRQNRLGVVGNVLAGGLRWGRWQQRQARHRGRSPWAADPFRPTRTPARRVYFVDAAINRIGISCVGGEPGQAQPNVETSACIVPFAWHFP